MKLYNKFKQKETRRLLRRDSTFTEDLIWRRVRNSQILGVRFRRQYSIDTFILDFYAPQIRLAIELDGASHEFEDAKSRDEWRQRVIEGYNIRFIRFTDTEVTNRIDHVLGEIERVTRELLTSEEPHPDPLLGKERE